MKTFLNISLGCVITATATMVQTFDAQAASAAGEIFKAKGAASAIGPAGNRGLKVGSPVFKGDIIKTNFSSRLEVLFRDSTKLVVGPRSSIAVNQFISKTGGRTAKVFALKAARGTFRFLSGKSRKSAYKISTVTTTIGIRGTTFDFSHRGRTSVLLYSGALKVCSGSNCVRLTRKCDLAVEQNGRIFKSHSSQLPPGAFKLTFPYIRSENNLSPNFRLRSADCDSGAKSGNHKNGLGGSGARGGNRSTS